MSTRLRCLVPGCNHTRGQRKGEPPIREDEEWICGDHWRLVPRPMRAIKARAFRRAKRLYSPRAVKAALRIWRRCAREAIERAVGL